MTTATKTKIKLAGDDGYSLYYRDLHHLFDEYPPTNHVGHHTITEVDEELNAVRVLGSVEIGREAA